MSILLAGLIDASLVMVLGLAAAAALRRRSAALRHWVLSVALLCGAVMPALEAALPAWRLPLPWADAATASTLRWASAPAGIDPRPPAHADAPSASADRRRDIPALALAAVWITGIAIGLTGLVAGLLRLRRIAARAEPLADARSARLLAAAASAFGVVRPVRLLRSRHHSIVVTWGVRKPTVLLPVNAAEWTDERLRVVLFHEIGHVSRADWIVQLLSAVVCCCYWFNPLLWALARRLRQESEQACDDLVLTSGIDGADYAAHLLDVARHAVRLRHAWIPATAIARPSTLEGRIRAMLNATLNRDALSRTTRGCTALAAIAAALIIAAAAPSAREVPQAAAPAASPARDADVRATQENLRRLAEETGGLPAARQPVAARAPQVAARTAGSSIRGALYDPLGGLLPGARIALTHPASGASYEAVTDHTGSFALADLPSGEYELTVALPGFSIVKTAVSLTGGAAVQRNLVLPIGSLEETVTVTGERPGGAGVQSGRGRPAERRTRTIPDPRQANFAFGGGIGGQISQPYKMVDVRPVYPEDLQRAGISGVVTLSGRIGIDGYMTDVRSLDADVHPGLIAAATYAVERWEYEPTRLNGVPVDAGMRVTVRFDLR